MHIITPFFRGAKSGPQATSTPSEHCMNFCGVLIMKHWNKIAREAVEHPQWISLNMSGCGSGHPALGGPAEQESDQMVPEHPADVNHLLIL